MNHLFSPVVPIFLFYLVTQPTYCAIYNYLGCYGDMTASRDLGGKVSTLSQLSVASCAQLCAQNGYPYAGIQEGINCFCGDSYGQYGASSDCNFTCGSDECGGLLSNSVYYAVDVDPTVVASRREVFMPSPVIFTTARGSCIRMGGDLASIISSTDMNNTATLVGSSAMTWFGLWRRLSTNDYEWAYEATPAFERAEFASFWESGETWSGACVALVTDDRLWKSQACFSSLPYVCLVDQNAYNDLLRTTEAYTDTTEETSDDFATSRLALLIVVPIMLVCFGGSCAGYGIHRLCRIYHDKHNKKQQMLLSNIDIQQGQHHKEGHGHHHAAGANHGLSNQQYMDAGYRAGSARGVMNAQQQGNQGYGGQESNMSAMERYNSVSLQEDNRPRYTSTGTTLSDRLRDVETPRPASTTAVNINVDGNGRPITGQGRLSRLSVSNLYRQSTDLEPIYEGRRAALLSNAEREASARRVQRETTLMEDTSYNNTQNNAANKNAFARNNAKSAWESSTNTSNNTQQQQQTKLSNNSSNNNFNNSYSSSNNNAYNASNNSFNNGGYNAGKSNISNSNSAASNFTNNYSNNMNRSSSNNKNAGFPGQHQSQSDPNYAGHPMIPRARAGPGSSQQQEPMPGGYYGNSNANQQQSGGGMNDVSNPGSVLGRNPGMGPGSGPPGHYGQPMPGGGPNGPSGSGPGGDDGNTMKIMVKKKGPKKVLVI